MLNVGHLYLRADGIAKYQSCYYYEYSRIVRDRDEERVSEGTKYRLIIL